MHSLLITLSITGHIIQSNMKSCTGSTHHLDKIYTKYCSDCGVIWKWRATCWNLVRGKLYITRLDGVNLCVDFLGDPLRLSHTETINAMADRCNITHTSCHHLAITQNQDVHSGPSFWQFQLSAHWTCRANPHIIFWLWFTFAATWGQRSMRKLKSSIKNLAF